ncbi:MAG: hypothetical protein HY720_20845 [Planctomycetes bacterium]|nr:hypothetical protein [Planctomycetota bacterium]
MSSRREKQHRRSRRPGKLARATFLTAAIAMAAALFLFVAALGLGSGDSPALLDSSLSRLDAAAAAFPPATLPGNAGRDAAERLSDAEEHHEGEHGEAACCGEPPARPPSLDERAAARARLEELVAAFEEAGSGLELARAESDELREEARIRLLDHVLVELHEGTLDPLDVLRLAGELAERSRPGDTAGVLLEALDGLPAQEAGEGVLEAVLSIARSGPRGALRRSAIRYLGAAWDVDGELRLELVAIAGTERDALVRQAAFEAMARSNQRNGAPGSRAGELRDRLLSVARASTAIQDRVLAVEALDLRGAPEGAIVSAARLAARDPSSAVRQAVADAVLRSGMGASDAAVEYLESAGVAGDAPDRQAIVHLLYLLGTPRALEALASMEGDPDPLVAGDAREYVLRLRSDTSDADTNDANQ